MGQLACLGKWILWRKIQTSGWRVRKSATFTGKREKSQSSSRFKITGSSSEQHCESEFLVTMRIVVRRKYKEIWYKLSSLLIQINLNRFYQVPNQLPVFEMHLPCLEQWTLKLVLRTDIEQIMIFQTSECSRCKRFQYFTKTNKSPIHYSPINLYNKRCIWNNIQSYFVIWY